MQLNQTAQRAAHALRRPISSAATYMSLTATALAQEEPAGVMVETGKSYVYQYLLVGLCLALGLFLLGSSPKREETIEKKDSLAYSE